MTFTLLGQFAIVEVWVGSTISAMNLIPHFCFISHNIYPTRH